MRVLINGMSAAGTRTGIGHYTGELVRGLADLLGDQAVHCFEDRLLARARELGRSLRRRRDAAAGPAAPRGGLSASLTDALRGLGDAWCRWRFRRCSRRGFDLYHEPAILPVPCDLPTVVTVHDLSVLLHPEWHPADRVRLYERVFERGLRQCVHVVTGSDATRGEVIRTLGLPADRVTRVYHGIRHGLRPLPADEVRLRLNELGLPERYLLCLGTIEPRKNVRLLLQAYGALPAAIRDRYPLLLVGSWGWNSGDIAAYLESEGRSRGVRYLGYLPESALPVLYGGARALVFPSRYEGFGLPPAEMLACGGAVLASTADAVAETVGTRAQLIDPDDLDGWRAAMERVCSDEAWWQSLRRHAPEAARQFTRERCAAETYAVYQRALGHGGSLARAA